MSEIILIAGARPNYMKIFPLGREIRQRGRAAAVVVHTGQHFDHLMSQVFFDDLGMPDPEVFLGVGSGTHGEQTGRIMMALEPILRARQPSAVVVVGDVNSTLAGALVAVKLGIPTVHVEAGLRSFDRSMPEEINRLATDAISDLLCTSCPDGDENLKREGVAQEKICCAGNVMIDSLKMFLPKAGRTAILDRLGLQAHGYVAVTLHRPSNVDDAARLKRLLAALGAIARNVPVIFPVHPRTRKMIEALGPGVCPPGVGLIDPLGYLDFLQLEAQAAAMVTDSGGVQEETTFLHVPCLTLRSSTERPITITQGTNRLCDISQVDLAAAVADAIAHRGADRGSIDKWDGHAAGRIVDAMEQRGWA